MPKYTPLNELELYDLYRAAYPDKFPNDDDDTYYKVEDFIEEQNGLEDIADLLGRVIMLTPMVMSEITGTAYHCFGVASQVNGNTVITAVAKRESGNKT